MSLLRRKPKRRVSEHVRPVRLGSRSVDVVFRQSNLSRSFRLKVDQGGVSVTAPLWVARKQMLAYVEAEADWVLRQVDALLLRETEQADYRAAMRGYVFFRGRKLKTVWEPQPLRKRPRFSAGEDSFHIEAAFCDAAMVAAWVRWFKREAAAALKARVEYFSGRMQLYPERVSVRDQRSKWGACVNRTALSFNARLIQAPPEILDYVVIHELAHIRYMTHGKRFWSLVARYCPEYKQHCRWLRDKGWTLQWPAIESLPEGGDARRFENQARGSEEYRFLSAFIGAR